MTIPMSDLRLNNLVWDQSENPALITKIASPEIGLQVVANHLHFPSEQHITYKNTNTVLAIPIFDPLCISALGFYQPIFKIYWLLESHKNIQLVLHPDKFGFIFLKLKKTKSLLPIPVNGAHAIQNLYYALVGEELPLHL